jgi:serine/threonine protein kinase
MTTEETSKLAEYIIQFKTREKKKCDNEQDELEEDLSPRAENRKMQCALLNMKKISSFRFGDKLGSGIQGTTNKFKIRINQEDSKIKNIDKILTNINNGNLITKTQYPLFYNKNTREIIVGLDDQKKQAWLNAGEDDLNDQNLGELYPTSYTQRMEGLMGLYLNLLRDMTPNYPYYYDMRFLLRTERNKHALFSSIEYNDFKLKQGNYAIITENIKNSITFSEFLKRAKQDVSFRKKVPDILKQILFSVYIAVKEFGLVHFDLHKGNILITTTTEETISYEVPLAPKVVEEIYKIEDDASMWNLEENYWILSEEKQDSVNYRVPMYQNMDLEYSELETPRYKNTKISDSEYHQEFKTVNAQIRTNGFLVKIIDFGFASMYLDENTWMLNPNASNIYNDVIKPTQPYVAIDMWRILILVYESIYGNPFLVDDLFLLYEDYATMCRDSLANNSKPLKDIIQLKYLSLLTDDMKDNEYFLNACLIILNRMNIPESNLLVPQPPI